MKLEYNGKEVSVKRICRRFSLHEILSWIGRESIEIFLNHGDEINCGIKHDFFIIDSLLKTKTKKEILVTAWSLIDVAYFSIKHSNDYIGERFESSEQFYAFLSVLLAFMQSQEEKVIDGFINDNDFLLYVWGFGGEQFKFQFESNPFYKSMRELYILLDLGERVYPGISIPEIIKEEMGVEWETLQFCLQVLWVHSIKLPNRDLRQIPIKWDSTLTREKFLRILDYYSCSYNEVRESSLGRQIFYTKPYIKTDKFNEIISINCFLNLFIYEHSIFWIIRNHYKNKGDQSFPSMFGRLYEEYFRELLDTYLNKDDYYRIPEQSNAKRADWEIQMGGYRLLVEQKSSILSIDAKWQESDVNASKTFLHRTVIKAIDQLNETEKSLGEGEFIKIVLMYEDYFEPEIIDNAFALPECRIKNDGYYWIVTLNEMEMLLWTFKNDNKLFEDIMKEKMHSNTGKSLKRIMNDKGLKKNHYLEIDKIQYYDRIIKDMAEKYL